MTDSGPRVVDVESFGGGVSLIRLNRPERLNAIDDRLVDHLHAAIDHVERDQECRTVILTGAGRGFCSGFDMRGGDYSGDPRERPLPTLLRGQERLADLVIRLHELPKTVVAAVNGPAAGGGFALATAADLRVGSDTAFFTAANIKIGVSGGEMGLSFLLPRIIGATRAAELLLTGRRMDAHEAASAGYLNRVVPGAELLDEARRLATEVAANSSFAVWMTKQLLDVSATSGSLRQAIAAENRVQVLCNFTGDVADAVAAFRGGQ